MIDRERIIQSVYERYGIVLGDDDPILLSSMTQEAILEQVLTQIDVAMEGVMGQLEMIGKSYTEEGQTASMQAAEQMTAKLKRTLEQTMQNEVARAVEQMRYANDHVLQAIERRAEELYGLRDWSLCSAGGSVMLFLSTAFLTWWNI